MNMCCEEGGGSLEYSTVTHRCKARSRVRDILSQRLRLWWTGQNGIDRDGQVQERYY